MYEYYTCRYVYIYIYIDAHMYIFIHALIQFSAFLPSFTHRLMHACRCIYLAIFGCACFGQFMPTDRGTDLSIIVFGVPSCMSLFVICVLVRLGRTG